MGGLGQTTHLIWVLRGHDLQKGHGGLVAPRYAQTQRVVAAIPAEASPVPQLLSRQLAIAS